MVFTTSMLRVMVFIGEGSKPSDMEITIASVSSWSAPAPAVIELNVFQVHSPRIVQNDSKRGIFPFKFRRAPFKTKNSETHRVSNKNINNDWYALNNFFGILLPLYMCIYIHIYMYINTHTYMCVYLDK